jgi:fucose permease
LVPLKNGPLPCLSSETMNRLAAIVIPPVMGAIADHWGAGQSFVILGTVLIVLCVPVTLITRRAGRTATNQAEPTVGD